MNTYVKSGFAPAVVGLGVLASGSSAYAASGCLTPAQSRYSLTEQSDKIQDAMTAADAKGFRCNVVASELSVRQPGAQAKVLPKPVQQAKPQYNMPASVMDD